MDPSNHNQPSLDQHGVEIQAFGTVCLLPLALANEVRQESCQLLNQILADSITLHSHYKKHRWLMRGYTFYQLHLILGKHANEQEKLTYTVAERIQNLGGVAVADPRHVAEITKISRPPNGVEQVPVMLSRLLDEHQQIIAEVREAAHKTAESGDDGTSDLLVSNVLRTNERQVGFLAEHLADTLVVWS